jgi:Kyakuja-Dileera-Zisupton transposase
MSFRAKYGLAMVNRLLQVYGSKIGAAYDIGCAFETTVQNSSLGERARQLGFRLMVGAFHGHAHNRGCQVRWHPLYIKGTGHFEGEGCEHVFSSSNDQARTTRHASWFHRLQAILEHFDFWDEDKYAALGKGFLFGCDEAKAI